MESVTKFCNPVFSSNSRFKPIKWFIYFEARGPWYESRFKRESVNRLVWFNPTGFVIQAIEMIWLQRTIRACTYIYIAST